MKTMVNGKEIKLVTRNDILAIVSQETAKMLGQGFNLYFCRGSQGEEGKVCLTDDGGRTVYVFWVHVEFERTPDSWEGVDLMCVTGKKYSNVYNGKTLWFNEGELFFEKKWYNVSDRRDIYVESAGEYFKIKAIQKERSEIHYSSRESNNLPSTANKPALKLVKKIRGYKTTSLKEIDFVRIQKNYGYIVYFTKESGKNPVRVGEVIKRK